MKFTCKITQLLFIALMLVCFCFSKPGVSQQTKAKPGNSLNTPRFIVSENAQKLGFDVDKLNEIDRRLSALVKEQKVIGCSALIYRKGEEVLFGTWGNRNQRRQDPVSRDTIFRIYSMSKPITSVAAMQLAEQGKLDIDAPVSNYLPEFKDLKVLEKRNGGTAEVPPKRPMMTRDLLRHTSGLTYGFFGNTPIDQAYRKSGVLVTDLNLQSTVKKLGQIPLLYHPGARFHYSASSDVLGRVVEVVSEKSFDDYLQANIFKPLNMKDSFFTVPEDKQSRFAQLYKINNQGKLVPADLFQSLRFFNPANKFYSGGGGLCSTVDDYLSFCKMLLNKGKQNVGGKDRQEIIKAETIEQMFKNQLGRIDRRSSFKFGLGFRAFPEGDHGWGGAAGTRFWVNPNKEMAIIYMMQIMPTGDRKYGELVRKIAYEAMN